MSLLENKVVVITGASKGFGKALANAFAKERCRLSLASRSIAELETFAKMYRNQGVEVLVSKTDVSNEKDVQQLAEKAVDKYGCIDIWINNAGVLYRSAADELDAKEVERVFMINTFGTMYGCKWAFRQMKKQKSGQIINVISTTAKEGKENESAYSASKSAVIGFGQALRKEALPYGVKVTDFHPGGMDTSLFEGLNQSTEGFMDPAELAKAIVCIASLPNNAVCTDIVIRRF